MSANGKNEKTTHLVWCAMIALLLVRQDGRVQSEQQENLFLGRWFADAERQRRFSRDVASDIRWMLQQGRSLGVLAPLAKKLDTSGGPPPAIFWNRRNSSVSPGGWKPLKTSNGCTTSLATQNGSGCASRVLTRMSVPCTSPNPRWKRRSLIRENRPHLSRSESRGMWRHLACYSPPVAGRFSPLRNLMSCFSGLSPASVDVKGVYPEKYLKNVLDIFIRLANENLTSVFHQGLNR